MRTKIFALLLALCMVFSMSLSAFATETTGQLELDVGNGKGTVTVDVYLRDCAGVTNGGFTVTYDAQVLTLVEATVSDACAMSSLNTETAGSVSVTWVGSDLSAESTLMLTLKLEVAEDANQSLTYSATSGGIFTDTDEVEVAGDTVVVSFDAPVDTTALQKAIKDAEALDEELYTEESFAAMEEVLADAIAVLADAEATQEEVNNATKALKAAMAALELKAPDTSKLEAAIKAAEALEEELYTEASFEAVAEALEEAKAVLAKENATQDEVDAATKALEKALAALKKVGDAADTGDQNHIGLWMALMVLSTAAIAALTVVMVRSGRGKQVCRFLSMVLVISMVLTMAPVTGTAIVTGDGSDKKKEDPSILENLKDLFDGESLIVEGEDKSFVGTVKQVFDKVFDLKLEQNMNTAASVYKDDQIVRILVELEGECLLDQGYTQNQINEGGSRVTADTAKLETLQDHMVQKIVKLAEEADLGEVSVKYHYTAALNGMAMSVPYGLLAQIVALEGVKSAFVCSQYNAPEPQANENVADPNMYATASSFGTVQTWETLGYTGQGMTIAILDTGLDIDHPSFVDAPKDPRMTEADIEKVLTELNAYTLFTQTSAIPLEADDLYFSEKVPYGFNYVDCGLDITHDYDAMGEHGSHVAGTAAANKIDSTPVVGVAPDAQIIVMKLFGQNGGAYTDDILAAIEDCILLNIDVINMSLGSNAGFAYDSVLVNEVYSRVLEHDMMLCISAGNSASSAYGNSLGTNVNYTSDPDNGLVNSPGTYLGATCVASIENTHVMMNYFAVGELKVPFVDATYTFHTLEGTYEYVVVPGYGRVEDYEGLDLTGKIALVSRGGGDNVTFVVKQENAKNAGAVALIVYDNTDGNYISMYDGGYLPNVFISKAHGAQMIEAATDGVGTIEILPITAETGVPYWYAGEMSDFSCWGVTPDLQLTPDVTAPGGSIYSCINNGEYGTMSGTSMASPHIAGMSALLLQHLRKTYPGLDDATYHIITESLVMCTAEPVVDANGILYSPRKQGAGSANVYKAITSPVYLTSLQKATGELTPKASMGDDPERTGTFTFSFDMNNLTATAQTYTLEGMLLTDQYIAYEGKEYMSETGKNLTGDVTFEVLNSDLFVQYDMNGDDRTDMEDVQCMLDAFNGLIATKDIMDVNEDSKLDTRDAQALYLMLLDGFEAETQVCVPANGSLTVKVTIQLSEEDMQYMDDHYENGIYVDGFVRAYAEAEEGVDLSLPFMGFYGNWKDAPVFDTGWYYEDEETVEYNRYLHVIFATLGSNGYAGLGMNPYLTAEKDPYDPAHNVLSPNGDGYYDYVPEIYVSMMRSAEILDFTWTDDATGEELFYEYYAYARKSYYWSGYGMAMPVVYGDGGLLPFTLYDENGELMVEDLQKLTLTIRAYLDDGDLDNVEVDEDGNPVPNHAWADDVMEIPVVIDMKAPTMDLDSLKYFTEDGRNYVSFDIEDNYDIAAVVTTTVGGGSYDYLAVHNKVEGEDGEKATVTLDITDYDATFEVVLCDYGCNETYYELSNVGNENLSEDTFYAFRRYSMPEYDGYTYATDILNGWYSFESADEMLMHTSQEQTNEPTVFAAEYVDGYIFGAHAGKYDYNELFVMKAGSWDRIPIGSDRAMHQTVYEWPGRTDYTYFPLKMIALDMTYDYTTGTMYMLANALEHETYFPEGETNILLSVDLATGDVKILGKIFAEEDEAFLALTLACDNDGILYTVNYENGKIYTIDKTPVETTATYGYGTYQAKCISTGEAKYWPAAYTQSMTVDHATNKLYWAGYQGTVGKSYFMEIDKENGEILSLVNTEDNAEMVGLFKPWDSGEDIIASVRLTGIALNKDALYLNVGQNATLSVSPQPYNAALREVTWSSSNEAVATVNEYGVVLATGIGTATITATCGRRTTECTVSVSDVSGTLFAHSDEYWLLLDAGRPGDANQVADAMVLDGQVSAAAFRDGWLYVSVLEERYDENYNSIFTTKFYKLNASTLHGEQIGSWEGKTTALAFNYADGFLYGLRYEELYEEENQIIRYNLIRVNMSTGETLVVNNLDSIYPFSDALGLYQDCSGALAIDYEGNFYVNGSNADYESNLVRFNLDENDQIVNVTEFVGFTECNYSGDAMVWSERNGGLLHIAGDMLQWVNVSDMENVITIPLGTIRGAGNNVYALSIPITNEPEVKGAVPDTLVLDESYSIPEGETAKVIPTLNPWNAVGTFTYTIADETIAKVDENGTVTGLTIGQTTLTVTETASGLTATTVIDVVKNPGYLYGYMQANITEQVPLEVWGKLPISNVANYSFMHQNTYDFTVYAAAYYDGLVYAVGHYGLGGYYAFTVNPSNFTYKVLYELDVMVRAMAFDYTTGTMYALAYSDVIKSGLYQVDLDTMEMTLVGDNDLGATLVSMAIDDEGMVYTADSNGQLYTMDKHTAKLTATGISSHQSPYLSSMTYDYNNDTIYWAIGGDVYSVDTEAGTLTSIGRSDAVVSGLFAVPRRKIAVPETMDPAGVAMKEKDTVAVGNTLAIKAVVLPVSVSTVDQTLTWASSDETIATVDENGVITGVAPGKVTITATDAKGNYDTIEIVVTAEERFFYGYDELSNAWVRFDTDGKILETWADEEGLSPIASAQYIDGVLYAYDADGYFYTVDTETFQRTKLGEGIHGKVTSLEAWDNSHDKQVYFVDNNPYVMIDMDYSVTTGAMGNPVTTLYGVMMAHHVSDWRDSFSYIVAELDMQTGEIVNVILQDALVDGMSLRPTNLIHRGEHLLTINGYITGMITHIDPDTGYAYGDAICPGYWGDFNGGRSLIEDPLTGEVYAIRDMRTEYIGTPGYTGEFAASVLCKISLSVGYVEQIATVGSNMRITGMFIK